MVLSQVRSAGGFCAQHADGLRRVEVEALKSTLGISQVYLDTMQGLVRHLEELGTDAAGWRSPCPACAYRDEGVAKNTRYLLDELAESERSREGVAVVPMWFRFLFELADPNGRESDRNRTESSARLANSRR